MTKESFDGKVKRQRIKRCPNSDRMPSISKRKKAIPNKPTEKEAISNKSKKKLAVPVDAEKKKVIDTAAMENIIETMGADQIHLSHLISFDQ